MKIYGHSGLTTAQGTVKGSTDTKIFNPKGGVSIPITIVQHNNHAQVKRIKPNDLPMGRTRVSTMTMELGIHEHTRQGTKG